MARTATPAAALDVPVADGEDKKADIDMLDYMREHFAKQPKMMIKTKTDALFQRNGYTFLIKANEKVAVPEEVADELEAAGYI